MALGKEMCRIFPKNLYRGQWDGPQQRIILFLKKIFAEGLQPWPSAKKCCRNFIFKKKIFAEGNGTALGKGPFFAEGLGMALGKEAEI